MMYDVAVVGGGAAGTMAACRSAELGSRTVLLERNDVIGRKILMTGKGRCNVTNMAPIGDFIAKFGKEGAFFRSAFNRFFNEDLIEFFKSKGLELKVERQNRVFPATDKAASVVAALREHLSATGALVRCGARVTQIALRSGIFSLTDASGGTVQSRRVILATGGASYKATGSSGDGFTLAGSLGHTVTALAPGLVPLKTKEAWVKEVQGLALKNISFTVTAGRRSIISPVGELMFTHFGVSGPLVLDLSADIVRLAESGSQTMLLIDLKPGLTADQVERRLLSDIKQSGSREIANFLRLFMPSTLCPIVARLASIPERRKASQLTTIERRALGTLLKGLPLTITGSLPLEEAMVTAGGIPHREIDPRTMQSRIVPGLFFAGEIIYGAAASGGYNLQQAFSTGYLAAEEASRA